MLLLPRLSAATVVFTAAAAAGTTTDTTTTTNAVPHVAQRQLPRERCHRACLLLLQFSHGVAHAGRRAACAAAVGHRISPNTRRRRRRRQRRCGRGGGSGDGGPPQCLELVALLLPLGLQRLHLATNLNAHALQQLGLLRGRQQQRLQLLLALFQLLHQPAVPQARRAAASAAFSFAAAATLTSRSRACLAAASSPCECCSDAASSSRTRRSAAASAAAWSASRRAASSATVAACRAIACDAVTCSVCSRSMSRVWRALSAAKSCVAFRASAAAHRGGMRARGGRACGVQSTRGESVID
jgi:hypothetical protein